MNLYRALLHLYPSAFRAEYGTEMCAVFAVRRRDASSTVAVAALWLETVFDVLLTAFQVHWDVLRRDLQYTVRALRRSPGFSITTISVAAIGIGATTAAFSLADHVLFRSLPFPDADRLVELWEDQSPSGYPAVEPSPPNYRDWRHMSRSFAGMAAFHGISVNMLKNGEPQQVEGVAVTSDLLPMVGARPVIGRIFSKEDDRTGAPGTVVLSDRAWKGRFGSDSSVLGRKVFIDGEPYSIIGVMPPDFFFPRREVEIWTAARFKDSDFEDRTNNWLWVLGKLRPGVSIGRARSEMRAIASALSREFPNENRSVSVTLKPLREAVSSRSPRMLLLSLLGASLFVLLIACTNLANLLLARALSRRKELAVRTAIGADRLQLIRQMLTESIVLGLCGGVFGVLLAAASLPLLSQLIPAALPLGQFVQLDTRILGFALVITSLTTIGFGMLPAVRACSGIDSMGIREGSRGGIGGQSERLRRILVVAEITASVVLLICSGLLMRALMRVQETDPGFQTTGVLTMRTSLPMPKYAKTSRRTDFYSHVLGEIRRLPRVTDAAYTSFLPMVLGGGIWPVTVPGYLQEKSAFRMASLRFVTTGFFSSMKIPLLLGRDVSESDTLATLMTAVVSESFVQRYWPQKNPLGQKFEIAGSVRTVVGVAGNVKVRGLERSSEPQVYLPYKQMPDGSFPWYAPKDLVIRSSMNPTSLARAARRIIANADPEQPASDVQTLGDIVEAQTSPRVIQLWIVGTFATLAFVLAGIGIHGLLSFSVSRRSQEIGVRIAMGAQSTRILTMILKEGAGLAAAGLASGLFIAYQAARAMQTLLAGVTPGDALTFSAGIVFVTVMALVGSLFPALRATRTDPIAAIRAD